MKRATSLRVAGGLLALTLMTSCFVGGTFAKYITKAESDAGDLARVAKWGVTVSMGTGDLFDSTYAADDKGHTDANTTEAITNSVVGKANAKVVAPGTTKSVDNFFTLSGSPEVAVKVDIKFAKNNADTVKDVVLPKGTYTDYTNDAENFTFDDEDYYPVVFTLKSGETVLKQGKIADIQAYLNEKSGYYAANTDLSKIFDTASTDGKLSLSWKWDFTDADPADEISLNDKKDTFLGQAAADPSIIPTGVDVSTAFDFTFSVTVTQVD